jgi:hypothetical protein
MHVFRHPKFYEEYRKRAKEAQRNAKRQASSDKQQAIDETVPHCDIEEASSDKPQASSKSSSSKR